MPFERKKQPPAYHSYDEALEKLRHFCAYQERCHQEVRKKLGELGVYGEKRDEIITDLILEKYLNEERFAKSYARGKFNFKHWGRMRIRQELKRRDVTAYCIKKAMEEIDDDDYYEKLSYLITRKAETVKAKNTYERNNKLAAYAIRKGYESGLVWEVVKGVE